MRAVAKICRRLAGIPLAIELAAARVGPLSPEQIANRLDGSIGLLTGGDRTAVPRHRTLQGALDWSYELLGEQERALFRRLAVFAGGWTLEAAEAVGAAGSVLDLLSGLVTKSLMFAESTDAGDVRYTLLEPVRQYAQEKLEDSGEAEAASRRHAEYFVALAEEAEPELVGPRQVEWFARLDAEHGNVRAALSWALEQGETEPVLRLAGALRPFWFARGYYGEGRRWLEEALSKAGPVSAATRVKALEALAFLADQEEDMRTAEKAAEEGLRLSAHAEVGGGVVASLRGTLGDVALMRGDYEGAKESFESGLALYQEAGDRRGSAWILGGMGLLAWEQGHQERAKELFEEVLVLARELDDGLTIGTCISVLGFILMMEGDSERATALNQEAMALLRDRGHRGMLVRVVDNQGWVALLEGDHDRARAIFEENLVLCKDLNDRVVFSMSLEALACVAAAVGEAARAATLLGATEALLEVGYHLYSQEWALREPYLASARSQLHETAWQVAWAEGRAMSMEQATEYALSAETPAASSSLAPDQHSPEPRPLTRREREIAALVARGLTNRQIASGLVISEHTARQHVKNILKKLGLHSREQVVSHLHDQ